jgi:hypothetical protein
VSNALSQHETVTLEIPVGLQREGHGRASQCEVPVASQGIQGQPPVKLPLRRVEVRLLNEAAVRSLIKQLRKQADDLEEIWDKLFGA